MLNWKKIQAESLNKLFSFFRLFSSVIWFMVELQKLTVSSYFMIVNVSYK